MKYKAITRNCKENVYDFYVEKDFLSKKPKMGKIKSLIGFSRHVDIHAYLIHKWDHTIPVPSPSTFNHICSPIPFPALTAKLC